MLTPIQSQPQAENLVDKLTQALEDGYYDTNQSVEFEISTEYGDPLIRVTNIQGDTIAWLAPFQEV